MQGKPKEVFTQVVNNALPAGSISVDDVVKQMNAAKYGCRQRARFGHAATSARALAHAVAGGHASSCCRR